MNQQERNRRISEGLRLAWKRRKDQTMKPVPEPDSTPFAAAPHRPAGEEIYRKYCAERPADEGPEGTRESLERCAKMLETYGPDCFPANDEGQVDFARSMMDSTADEIRAFLKTLPPEPEVGQCEHGVKDGDWCEPCNKEMKTAAREQLEGFDCSAGFCGGLGGDNGGNRPTFPDEVAKPISDEVKRIMGSEADGRMVCSNCAAPSESAGQFLPGKRIRWVCSDACRKELCDRDSYDDLAASGGIVGAP